MSDTTAGLAKTTIYVRSVMRTAIPFTNIRVSKESMEESLEKRPWSDSSNLETPIYGLLFFLKRNR